VHALAAAAGALGWADVVRFAQAPYGDRLALSALPPYRAFSAGFLAAALQARAGPVSHVRALLRLTSLLRAHMSARSPAPAAAGLRGSHAATPRTSPLAPEPAPPALEAHARRAAARAQAFPEAASAGPGSGPAGRALLLRAWLHALLDLDLRDSAARLTHVRALCGCAWAMSPRCHPLHVTVTLRRNTPYQG
jgi:hypothetical protein